MLRWIIVILFLESLSGCAAIQGAQGDAAMAKKTAAAQTTTQNAQDINSDTDVPPLGPSTTPAQRAGTNAAKMIAPLTH
jgi:hypothetical protein